MADKGVTLSPYRWVVLATFMLVNVAVQVLWICYAPVASTAAAAYGVPRDSIDLLANLFMLIYIPVAFPAAWAIDTFGFKKAVGFGVAMMGVFGMVRAAFPSSYTAALIGTIGISIGQPFLLTAFTKLAALWFPRAQRATITGVIFLALFTGIGLGETLTPSIVAAHGVSGMQLIYGAGAAAAAALFLVFARGKPRIPVEAGADEERALVLDSLGRILRNRSVYLLCLALFVGSGIVNGVFTLIDGLGKNVGFTADQGVLLTAMLLVGGVVGSIVIPMVSDGMRRRKPVIVGAILLAVPVTLGLVFGRVMPLEIACFFVLGFLVTGVTPVAYQYGAEITYPAPEGTSNGVFALMVQASGLLIVLMDALHGAFGDSYIPSFAGLAALLLAAGGLAFMLKESPDMVKARAAAGRAGA